MKMASPMYVYVGIFVLFAIITQGNAWTKRLMCYECNSIDNPACGDPFRSSLFSKKICEDRVDEEGNPAACLTIQKTLTSRSSPEVLHALVRGCGFTTEKQYELKERGLDVTLCINRTLHFIDHDIISRERICPCITDGCNGAYITPKTTTVNSYKYKGRSCASQMGFNLVVLIASIWLMVKNYVFC